VKIRNSIIAKTIKLKETQVKGMPENEIETKRCYKCKNDKQIDSFSRDKSRKDGRRSMCKECANAHKKEYRSKNKDKVKKYRKTYREKHPQNGVGQYRKYREKRIIYGGTRRIKIKTEVITHYGNGECSCVRCGFSDIRALTIDHINGNGKEHRSNNKYVNGNHVYEWLKKNGFPEGYQTLCMNCQYIKRSENHECSGKVKKGKENENAN
jgi:hypothetical protein